MESGPQHNIIQLLSHSNYTIRCLPVFIHYMPGHTVLDGGQYFELICKLCVGIFFFWAAAAVAASAGCQATDWVTISNC